MRDIADSRRFLAPSLIAGGALALMATFACGAPSTPTPSAPSADAAPPAPPLNAGPLEDHVPAAGLRWMVVLRPAELMRRAWLKQESERLLEARRLDAFREVSGIQLLELPAALVAGFDYSTLYAAEVPNDDVVERQLLDRLLDRPDVRHPHPALSRIVGVRSGTPFRVVRHHGRFVAVAVGDPLPAKAVEAYARNKLKRSPPALRGAALKHLPADLRAYPLRFYALGPFDAQWAEGARGLLGATRGLAVVARPLQAPELEVTTILSGEYEAGASTDILRAWEDLARSRLGSLLGLDEPRSAPIVAVSADRVKLTVVVAARPFFRGLAAAVTAEVSELLDLGTR